MSLESVVPTALIRQLQISLRDDLSLPCSDLSSDASTTLPSIQDAIASIDPSLDPSARCSRCGGGRLCGQVSGFCVYCGEGFKGGEGAPPEISFLATNSYKWLLGSLGLDGSEAVNLDPELATPNKGRDPPKSSMTLADLLDLKLAFSPTTINATNTETEAKNEPGPTTYGLNLSGIDLDRVFKETKKETPQIRDAKNTQNHVPSGYQTSAMNSFAMWEADFASKPVNPAVPVPVSAIASENFSKSNIGKMVSKIETQTDEACDEWEDFTGSGAVQNSLSGSGEEPGPSVENREPVKSEGDNSFDLKDAISSDLDPCGSPDPGEEAKTSPEDTLPIENREALDADGEDFFDDSKDFSSSGGDQGGLSGPGVKPESGSSELVPVKNIEPLNLGDDIFDDWKNFTGPGVAESGLSVPEEKTEPVSVDLFTINMETEAADTKTSRADADGLFDERKDFNGSGLDQSRSSALEENSKTNFWDPLTSKNIEQPGNIETLNTDNNEPFEDWKHFAGSGVAQIGLLGPEEKTQPSSQDPLTVEEIEPCDRAQTLHVESNNSFDDWKDFTESSAVQARLPNYGEKAEPRSGEQLSISTREQPSDNVETLNVDADDSFGDWKDITSSSSSAVESGVRDPGEKNENAIGNFSGTFDAWPMGGTESNKGSAGIDLWSTGVNSGVLNSAPTNGNTDLSDGWMDFMTPHQVKGTPPIDAVTMSNSEKDSSDNWKSESLNSDKELADRWFDEWQYSTGSSQSKKPNSGIIKENSNVGESKHEDSSDNWFNFASSGELKGNTETKAENNSTSDSWLNFTGINGVKGISPESGSKGPENESLSDDWQDFTSTSHVAAPVAYNTNIDFGDFIQSSSFSAPINHVNYNSLNGALDDPLSMFSAPNNGILNSNSNSNSEKDTDIQKILSQMNDLSFMLTDDLSVPDKLDSK